MSDAVAVAGVSGGASCFAFVVQGLMVKYGFSGSAFGAATAGHVACAAVVPFVVPFGGDGYIADGKE